MGSLMFDPLSAFFLICFGVGLFTGVGALLLGDVHGGSATHGGGIAHGGDIAHGGGIAHSGDATHGGGIAHSGDVAARGVSFLNVNTLLGFLLGFGAAGFVVEHSFAGIPLFLNLLAAAAGGLVFAYIIYWVLANILIKGQSEYLWAGDFNLVGMEGSVTSTIFAGHWGEVSYVLNHNRAAIPAKERDGREVRKGETVIIIEVDEGVAVVLPKEEFMRHTGKMEG